MSPSGLKKTSLSNTFDCINAALISTEANLKLWLAAIAMRSLKLSLEAFGLYDCGFKPSWKPQATKQALQGCF